MTLAAVTLDDKYTLDRGRIYLTGIQALVRLPMMQRQRDAAAGLNTAGFISGYRGSPLSGLDQNLWHAKRFLEQNHIHFLPGINEDLAATAAWGSQQTNLFPDAKYDGVFALWYGKGPGVDRTGDVFKHANATGTARHGGVLVLAGDDHAAKSSTLPHQSEYGFIDASIPVLNPAGVQDILDLGLYGWAMSRFSGCWVAFKAIAETADSSASVLIDPARVDIVTPADFALPPGGLNIRWPDYNALEIERRLRQWKLPAVQAFARANRLDRVTLDSPRARLGIAATGKSYLDLRQALADLGIDDALAAAIGLRLYKVALTWPLEPEGISRFAAGLEEILVVEEKRPVIEQQLKDVLYGSDARPRIVGKEDERGAPLLSSTGELDPMQVARVVAQRIARFHSSPRIADRLAYLAAKERQLAGAKAPLERIPYFCSGCPHNTSTRVPEGSRATAGIGCHYMAIWMDRDTATYTQMGGEGVPWLGQAPFTNTPHIFANLGDGTYYHSGSLAIRAAVAAGANITYKILYNDAVAMTGGQPIEGQLTVPQITQQLAAEGVKRIVVVSDEPGKYPVDAGFAPGVETFHRERLDAVQRDLRDTPGVSVLVYDQTCAAEKRRRRKRGRFPDPQKRVFINDLVCEGCGDCSRTSNCLSVVPVETEFGRKRAIDQSSCNKDYSCVEGFCPSFVTVHGGALRRHHEAKDSDEIPPLPAPALPALAEPYNILVAGVGGTGVVTIGALLGMAAHLEGKGCSILDMTGLAQKGGAVLSHIRIAGAPGDIHAVRITTGSAHLCGFHRCHAARDGAARRFHRDEPVPARLRLSEGLDPGRGRSARARHRFERRRGRFQSPRLPLGPLGGGRARRGRAHRRAGARGRRAAVTRYRRAARSTCRFPHRLPERRLRRAVSAPRAPRARRRAVEGGGRERARRGGRAQLLQADGLQGRVRGGAALHQRRVPEEAAPPVRRRFHARVPPCAAAPRQARPSDGSSQEGPLWAVDDACLRALGEAQIPARHATRSVRPQRGAPDRAPSHRRVRGDAGRADRRPVAGKPCARRRTRGHTRADPRLWPHQASEPDGGPRPAAGAARCLPLSTRAARHRR